MDPLIQLVDEFEKMDWGAVTELLRTTYWCKGITRTEVELGARHSALVVGAIRAGVLIGHCRVVSDTVRYAYLMDVVVHPDFRRQGIGRRMVKFALEHPRLKHVYQWMLRTTDAQAVYAPLGFRTIVNPDQWMVIQNNRPQRDPFPID